MCVAIEATESAECIPLYYLVYPYGVIVVLEQNILLLVWF